MFVTRRNTSLSPPHHPARGKPVVVPLPGMRSRTPSSSLPPAVVLHLFDEQNTSTVLEDAAVGANADDKTVIGDLITNLVCADQPVFNIGVTFGEVGLGGLG